MVLERNSKSAMENKISEEQRQKEKEESILLALQKDRALIRRGLEVFGMKKDGSTILVSKSSSYGNLWNDALNALKKLKYSPSGQSPEAMPELAPLVPRARQAARVLDY